MSSPSNIEVITAFIHEPNPSIICVTYVYTSKLQWHITTILCFNYFTELGRETCPIILTGDFNFPDMLPWVAHLQFLTAFVICCFISINQWAYKHSRQYSWLSHYEQLDSIHNVTVHPHNYQPIATFWPLYIMMTKSCQVACWPWWSNQWSRIFDNVIGLPFPFYIMSAIKHTPKIPQNLF